MAAQGYRDGDLKCILPALALERAIAAVQDDDPKEGKLSDYRTFNGMDGGLSISDDLIEFNGVFYTLVKVEPQEIWRNMPSQFLVVLRRTGGPADLN